MYNRELNNKEMINKPARPLPQSSQDSAIYINSNVTLVKVDEILLLEMHMKAHDVFRNLTQSISNHMV